MARRATAYAPSERSSVLPLRPVRPSARLRQPLAPARPRPLDESGPFEGIGRSLTFPFAQWRDVDEHETVFFDEGEGHPLVFVHGLGGNATHFEPILGDLVHRYRVIGLDLVGLGWTRKPRVDYTIDLLRDHLLSFLDRHDIRRPTLIGHSLGGAVCLGAALERPGEFRSLALLCAAGVAPLPTWMRAAAPLFLRERLLFYTLGLGANFILDNVFVDRQERSPYVRWFRQSALRDDPGAPNLREFARVCETLCTDVARRDFSRRLGELELPVLALWGDRDRLTHQRGVLRQIGQIRRLRTVVLRRCGHMPMIERPQETLYQLERLLEHPP
jgi:pimeloyl-ACP methyl ester carboxylesterase